MKCTWRSVVCLLFSMRLMAAGDVTRTVCSTNDMEEMLKLETSMQDMGHPIGNLRGQGMSCTGTLVGVDLFLTAEHCQTPCSSLTVTFGYLARSPEVFKCREIVEVGSSSYNEDYMLVRLQGSPGVQWGYYELSDRPLATGDALLMIHHPMGDPMTVSRKNCSYRYEKGGLLYHNCDTNPGSSGSAILVPDYAMPSNTRVVGVHTLGGCNSNSTQFNSGPSVRYLATISEKIRSLIKN